MHEEILDIVDLNDQVIGAMLRSEVYAKKLNNFRVVNVFLVNSDGKLWIPRRTASKKLFPLCLDASMGGHVMSGETYQEALKRELLEELNLDIDTVSYQMVGKLNPHDHKTSAFMNVYKINTDKTPQYNTNDFCESYWLSAEELLEKLAAGDVAKNDLPKIVRQLFCN